MGMTPVTLSPQVLRTSHSQRQHSALILLHQGSQDYSGYCVPFSNCSVKRHVRALLLGAWRPENMSPLRGTNSCVSYHLKTDRGHRTLRKGEMNS